MNFMFNFCKLTTFFRLKVKDLLHAVGKKCGIDPAEIDKLDLENVIERAVAINVCLSYLSTIYTFFLFKYINNTKENFMDKN